MNGQSGKSGMGGKSEKGGTGFSPCHFPEIIMAQDGAIVLCPQCKSSSVAKQLIAHSKEAHRESEQSLLAALYVCNSCGSVWRPAC